MSVIGTPIYPETSLDDIKTLITVTATYNNGDTKPATNVPNSSKLFIGAVVPSL